MFQYQNYDYGNTNTYQYDPLNRMRQLTYLDGQTGIYCQEMSLSLKIWELKASTE